jgi:hypothetical protein
LDSLLISQEDFSTATELTHWANNLIGQAAPGNADHIVKQIRHFQVIPTGTNFSVILLVEIERKKSMSSMVLNMRKDLGLSEDEQQTPSA